MYIMKKLITILACAGAMAYANAQGTVNFANSSANLITFQNGSGGVPTGGQYTAGLLYWAADPGAVNFLGGVSGFNMIKTSSNFITPGRFIGGTATTPGTTAGGASAWFAVVAWQSSFGSYDAALNGGGNIGYSSVFQNPTGDPNKVPVPDTPAALAGFTGINNVQAVPEPSTIALGILGAAGLLLRRRK